MLLEEEEEEQEEEQDGMDPALLLVMSTLLQLHQFMDSMPLSNCSATHPVPLLFFMLSAVLIHAAAIYGDAAHEFCGILTHPLYTRLMGSNIRDTEWRKHYGLSYPLFVNLVSDLTPHIKGQTLSMAPDAAVAMVLYRLCRGHNVRRLSVEFHAEPWAITRITNVITKAISTKLYSKNISIPRCSRLLEIVEGFKEVTGLPNMCGAIDGSPVKIHKIPRKDYSPAYYRSRHHFYAILLQAVCDHRKVFWDVCVKAPGATEDATHLRESSLFSKLMSGDVLQDSIVTIRGNHIRPYIVGDWCYPLLSFLLTPFSPNGSDASGQSLLDSCLMKGRGVIEEALGLLKGRWQILQNLNVGLRHAPQAIVSCCVLHNICQLAGEPETPLYKDPLENGPTARPLDSEKSFHYFGESIRQVLLEDLQERQQTLAKMKSER